MNTKVGREIRFRAIVIDDDGNKDLRYHCWPVRDKVFVEDGGFWMRYERVEQFTGLRDKKSFDIYEGDILKGIKGFNWLVEWNDNHACFQIRSSHLIAEVIDNDNFEVIGNMYEHKHLLSQ